MKRLTCLLCCLLLLPTLTRAQETLTPPPLPSAEELFVDGVVAEVVTIVDVPAWTYNPRADNEAQVVLIYDEAAQTWREFPFPDELEYVAGRIQQEDAHTFLVSVETGGIYREPSPASQWLLDTTTGEYTRVELMCGQRHAEPGKGEWVPTYEDFPKSPAFLCNTDTGEMRGPLPDDNWWGKSPSATSPDGTQVILFGSETVYSYQLESDAVIRLGENRWEIRTAQWIGDDLVLVTGKNPGDMSSPWVDYYLAKPKEAGSLDVIAQTIKPASLSQLENPPRYEWLEAGTSDCALAQLNLETGVLEKYPLGELCSEGVKLPDGDRLFYDIFWSGEDYAYWDDMVRSFYLPDALPIGSQLVRLNPYTGARTDLYSGEIEWLRDVTPDGNYAALLVDDNGILDMIMPRKSLPETTTDSHPRWLILDTRSGDVLYEAPTTWFPAGYGFYYQWLSWNHELTYTTPSNNDMESNMRRLPLSSLFPVGNRLFMRVEYSAELGNPQPRFSLIDLQGDDVIEHPVSGNIALVLPDERHVAVWTDPDHSTAAGIYDVETGSIAPLLRGEPGNVYESGWEAPSGYTDAYIVSFSSEPEGSALRVSVCHKDGDGYKDCAQGVTYRVEIEG